MKKSYLIIAIIASAALVSCSSEEFVGDFNPAVRPGPGKTAEITFNSADKGLTRADLIGADAAKKLNNQFVFAGTKDADPTTFVFEQYYAKWAENTANTTATNSSNWEYADYSPYGAGNTSISTLPSNAVQSIKYWDYSATQYDFAAYSLGKGAGTTPTYATASAIDKTTKSYTITGSSEELASCYISDLVTAYNRDDVSDFGEVVTFNFRSIATKIRMAFYETIPGYAVKDIQFYNAATGGTATTTPTLFTSTAVLPSGNGTMTVTFPTTGWANRTDPDYNKAHVAFAPASGSTASSTLTFDALADFATAERLEGTATTGWIGRTSNTATYPGGKKVADPNNSSNQIEHYKTILPCEVGTNLLLRIKYTLVSIDGSGEDITVDNASAVVPAEFAKWQPNYAYTYIFKLSDMTNGSTGVDEHGNVVIGLTPITLDAVVVDDENGVQETITTVATPSITTYSEGEVVTADAEYKAGNIIYVVVNNGTSNETLTVGTNANLYTVTLAPSTDTGDTPAATAAQVISEESVKNALINGTKDNETNPTTWTLKDANQWKLVVTKANTSLSAVTQIEAADSPTGNAISVNGAKFTAGTAGTVYAFEYSKEAVAATYNAGEVLAAGTSLNGYYTYDGTIYNPCAGDETADGTTRYYQQTAPASDAIQTLKIIKVAAGS